MTVSTTHPGTIHTALWQPRWRRLDQSLDVGQHRRWWFYPGRESGTEGLARPSGHGQLVLFNRIASREFPSEVRSATLISIEHAELGLFARVDTEGLDYVFRTLGGREYIVNAEETPGLIYDENELAVDDWTLSLTFQNLSAPLADLD